MAWSAGGLLPGHVACLHLCDPSAVVLLVNKIQTPAPQHNARKKPQTDYKQEEHSDRWVKTGQERKANEINQETQVRSVHSGMLQKGSPGQWMPGGDYGRCLCM